MTYPEDDRHPYGAHDEDPVAYGDFDEHADHSADDWGTYGEDADMHADFGPDDSYGDGTGDVPAEGAREAAAEGVGEGDATDKAGTVLMGALIVLAAVASVVMLFATSTAWMKIGVLAGLWAAVIGALLVARYRRQLAAERNRIADLEVLHELELDRELATHREQELILEQNYLDSLESRGDDTIAQLRAEIVALREHLAELLGQDLDEERIALRARAERLRELDAPQRTRPPLKDPVAHDRPTPRAAAHRAEATASGRVGTHTTHGPVGVGRERHDDPVDVPVVDNGFADAAPAGEPVEPGVDAGAAGAMADAGTGADAGVPGHTAGGGFRSGSFRAVPWEQESTGADVDSAPEPDQDWATDGGAEPYRGPQAETRPVPDTAESHPTAVLPRIGDDPAGTAGVAGAAGVADDAGGPRAAAAAPEQHADAGAHGEETAGAARATADDDAAAPEVAAADAAAPDAAAEAAAPRRARGRRRAEDHQDGLTVAELLAQMRARKQAEERD